MTSHKVELCSFIFLIILDWHRHRRPDNSKQVSLTSPDQSVYKSSQSRQFLLQQCFISSKFYNSVESTPESL